MQMVTSLHSSLVSRLVHLSETVTVSVLSLMYTLKHRQTFTTMVGFFNFYCVGSSECISLLLCCLLPLPVMSHPPLVSCWMSFYPMQRSVTCIFTCVRTFLSLRANPPPIGGLLCIFFLFFFLAVSLSVFFSPDQVSLCVSMSTSLPLPHPHIRHLLLSYSLSNVHTLARTHDGRIHLCIIISLSPVYDTFSLSLSFQ